MFILRSINEKDLADLFELSGSVIFINLPHDKKIISNKITKSMRAFEKPFKEFSKNYYMFDQYVPMVNS